MAENNLTSPLSSTLGGLQQLQGQAGVQSQNMKSPLGGLVGPGNISAAYPTNQWIDTSKTSIPIEVYNRNTGEVVKTYDNLIDYQADTMVVSGGATQRPSLQSGDIVPALANTLGSSTMIGANLAGPVGAAFGAAIGAIGFGSSLAESIGNAYKQFNEDPERSIELLATEQKDPTTGETFYGFDSSKLGKANTLSGGYVSELKAIPEGDPVSWNDTGTELNVNVAPAFAASETYKDYIEQLSGDLTGLTKDTDTDGTYLKQVNSAIQGLQSQYFYEAEQAAAFEAKFPDASSEAIEAGLQNQLAGYITKEDDLSEFKMQVYDSNNQLVEKSASDVFNELYDRKFNKVANDEYMGQLYAALEDPTISQDNKAIIYGQISAIYGANSNDKLKYHDMLQKGWLDYLGESSLILGISINDIASLVTMGQSYGSFKYLTENNQARTFMGLASGAVNMFSTMKAMNGVESIYKGVGKKGAEWLGNTANKVFGDGNLVSKGTNWFLNATHNTNAISAMMGTSTVGTGTKIGTMALDLGYQATADLTVDALKAGIQTLAGKETDLWGEFRQDFTMDLLFTYAHTGAMQMAMSEAGLRKFSTADLQRVIRDNGEVRFDEDLGTKTIKLHFEQRPDVEVKVEAEKAPEGEPTAFTSGDSEVKGLTNEELSKALTTAYFKVNNEASMRAAKVIDGILSHKKVRDFVTTVFDDKIAVKLLGYQSLAQTGDAIDLIKLSNMSNSNRVYSETMQEFLSTKEAREAYGGWTKALSDFTLQTGRTLSDADNAYINARQELMRVETRYGKDSDEYKRAESFYAKDINGVGEEDAAALQTYASAISKLALAIGDFEQRSGLQTANFFEQIQKYPSYIPVYMKPDSNGKVREVEYRRTHRKTSEEDVLVPTSEMESPTANITTHLNNIIANATRAKQMQAIVDVASKVEGIDVLHTTEETPDWGDLPYASILKKYKISDEIDAKINKIADDPDEYKAQLEKMVADSLIRRYTNSYAIARSQIDKQEATMGEGYGRLQKDRGQYKAGMTRADIDEVFMGNVELAFAEIIRGSKSRMSKFKEFVELDSPQSLQMITENLRDNLESFDRTDFMTTVANVVSDLNPMFTREILAGGWVERNSAEYTEEMMQDMAEGNYAYDISNNKKVSIGGTAINVYTQGKVETYYLKGTSKKNQEKADAIAEVLNAGLSTPYKNGILRVVSNVAMRTAQARRQAVSGTLPQRALPNKVRDTSQAAVAVGASAVMSPRQVFMDLANSGVFTQEELGEIGAILDRIDGQVKGYTENEVFNELRYGTIDSALRLAMAPEGVKSSEQYGLRTGKRTKNQLKYQFNNFKYNMKNIGKGGLTKILMTPGDIAESSTRSKVGQNTVMLELLKQRQAGIDFTTALSNAYNKGAWASRIATTDFSTKGSLTRMLSKWTPFSYSNFSDVASKVEAFVMDPVGYSARTVTYMTAYIMNLATLLSNEDTRKRYMNMSEYDRTHNLIISLGGADILTMPIDEGMVGLLSPFRTFTEILATQEPVTFWKIFGSILEMGPLDLSGFTEGDQFNFTRGWQKFVDSYAPTLVTNALEQVTNTDFYYGTNLEVTDDDLAIYGQTAEGAGDYTTSSKNSKILHDLANLLNIPQWKVQQTFSMIGGTVGEYALYVLDKLNGATDENTGGTDPLLGFYKPFVKADATSSSAFYEGINNLKDEKKQVQTKLLRISKDASMATGDELTRLNKEYQTTLDNFVLKTSDFLNKYLSVYSMTGGLTDSEASQIYYLFNFQDPYQGTSFMPGTAGSQASSDLSKQESYQASNLSARAVGGNYVTNKLVQDEETGVWSRQDPNGVRALQNTLNNRSAETVANLKQIASDANVSSEYQKVYNARQAIYNKGNLTKADYAQLDKLALDWDAKVAQVFLPYFQQNGTDALNYSKVVDLLDDWFIVTSDYEVNKSGRYFSAPNLNKQRGFAKNFIKDIYVKLIK